MQQLKIVIYGTAEKAAAQAVVDAVVAALPAGMRADCAPMFRVDGSVEVETRIILLGALADEATALAAVDAIRGAVPEGWKTHVEWQEDLLAVRKAEWQAAADAAAAAKIEADRTAAEKILAAVEKDATIDQKAKDTLAAIVAAETGVGAEKEA